MELPVEKVKRIAEISYVQDGHYYPLKEYLTHDMYIRILEVEFSASGSMTVTYNPYKETYRSAMQRLIALTDEKGTNKQQEN